MNQRSAVTYPVSLVVLLYQETSVSGALQALAGPAKRAKTFLCTVRHMGLLPVKQKNKPSAKKQLPHNAASMLAANRSASLGHQQTLSNAATRPAESDSKLPAALHHSASASRLVPLLGSASQASSGQARRLNANSDYNQQHCVHIKATAFCCLSASFSLL